MNKKINRRSFVKASFLGLGALTASFSPFRSFANNTPASTNAYSSVQALALYRRARELFYQKQYAAAAAIFEQLIAAFPARIEYYDGYAKVFGAQQKALQTAELFLKGTNANPNNPYFKQRLSLWLRRMAAGNLKDAAIYQSRYGVTDLWQHSAALLIAAIAIKPSEEFRLGLRDLPAAVERLNKANSKRGYQEIALSQDNANQIDNLTRSVSNRWAETRFPLPETFAAAEKVDRSVGKLNGKARRNLHNNREQKLREEAKQKQIKKRYSGGLDDAIARNIPGQVDKYGLRIINEIIDDSNTVGKLRRYYNRQNFTNRLITLNRLLYTHNDNTANALALASSLLKHNNGNGILSECRQLVNPVAEYVNILPSIYALSYYILRSRINVRENKAADARNVLLEGIRRFEGKGGNAYTLLEHYAMTFPKKDAAEAVRMLQALCGKDFDNRMDSQIQPYVKNYLESIGSKTLHVGERMKQLRALAKMQKLQGGNAYRTTEAEIAALKRELRSA